ncbi:hypothetical protein [Streptococcus ovuberis]|uniref:Uncharacterized protein n=1 Tax=Streptococcus ovuberis TaxID=1936207 RepID=A0A7X6MWU5_9STRE|nr:hypothetical protein [Streptococcus ovuberis]NKZ19845.1 hypothetical protein [Streptococcus ovuberis]
MTDYFAHIYYEKKFDGFPNDKLDYLGLFENLEKMIIFDKDRIKAFIKAKVKESKVLRIDINDYISHELDPRLEGKIDSSVIKAAYKYRFYCYQPAQRVNVLKMIVGKKANIL